MVLTPLRTNKLKTSGKKIRIFYITEVTFSEFLFDSPALLRSGAGHAKYSSCQCLLHSRSSRCARGAHARQEITAAGSVRTAAVLCKSQSTRARRYRVEIFSQRSEEHKTGYALSTGTNRSKKWFCFVLAIAETLISHAWSESEQQPRRSANSCITTYRVCCQLLLWRVEHQCLSSQVAFGLGHLFVT